MKGLLGAIALLLVCAAGVYAWKASRDLPHSEETSAQAATPSEIAAELGTTRTSLGTVVEAVDPELEARAEAIALRRQAVALNDQALVALESGDLERAIELLESCLAIDPEEAIFRRNLAETLARMAGQEYEQATAGSIRRAIEWLERAVELAPDRTALADRLTRWRTVEETEDGFWVESSEHFELAYDGSRDELLWSAGDLFEILEAAYLELGELFGRFPVEHGRPRIRVVLYRKSEFDGVTGLGHWAGGVFDGTVRVPVEDLGREKSILSAVLRHEVVHAFVRDVGGASVPAWLDEGLAQRFESPEHAHRSARTQRARRRLEGGELFPLERLREGIARWTNADEIRRAYDQSLALVARLESEYGERLPFEMIIACRDGASVEDTFATRTGVGLEVALETLREDL